MKILGTGLGGLVGSRIVELLQNKYLFANISRSTGVDITNLQQTMRAIKASDAQLVLHLAAKTDVDGCERDKNYGETGEAWRVNVKGTHNIVLSCQQSKKKIIYISTDFVFGGNKPLGEYYSEEDKASPINWYAVTKQKGEEEVLNSGVAHIILRLAYPYGRPFAWKKDFVQAIIHQLEQGKELKGVTDQIFMPTYIDDVATVIDTLIENNAEGIFHAVGSQALSPFDALRKIADVFGFDKSLISETTREVFFKDRALRPYNLALRNDKIERLGVKMRSFEEGLLEL